MTEVSHPNSDASGVCGFLCCHKKLIAAAVVGIAFVGAGGLLLKGRGLGRTVASLVKAEALPGSFDIQVTGARPTEGGFEIPLDTEITVDLKLPKGGIEPATVNSHTVMLVRTADQKQVPASVKLTGNRTLTLRPDKPLDASTNYTLCVTAGIRHRSGASVVPYASSFTTVNTKLDPSIKFEKVMLPSATGTGFTCVRIGPDGKLWASTDDGRFFRFPIEAKGELGKPDVITSLHKYANGPRVVIGFAFDPASTPTNPIIWVCNSFFTFADAPDFAGFVTRMAGPQLEDVGDVVVHLPRAVRDHMTNQPDFGPDGALYFPQGSSSAYGQADEIWGMRDEHLLTATILRLDTKKVTPGKPIDALTPERGGAYDPTSADAPLTIYATGIRNAYACRWHSNGKLYVPTNGSSAGGHTPAGGGAPPIKDVSTAEDDWLHRVTRAGQYCGHPNPTQNHYVLNGGNPTSAYDPFETFQYPVGTQPDSAYVRPAYSFGKHVSANGVIEYVGKAFGGKLNGALMVCRYNVGSDILVLTLDKAGNVTGDMFGIPGLSQLANPLDITEDRKTGNLYVSEYGALRITLMRPQ